LFAISLSKNFGISLNLNRDESGLWWFIGCRAFKINGSNGKPNLKYFCFQTHAVEDSEDEEGAKKKKSQEN
jgi:hypothetical protein